MISDMSSWWKLDNSCVEHKKNLRYKNKKNIRKIDSFDVKAATATDYDLLIPQMMNASKLLVAGRSWSVLCVWKNKN